MIIEILTLAALIEWIVIGLLLIRSIRATCKKICAVEDAMLGTIQSWGAGNG